MGREGEICRVVSLPHVKDVTINPDVFRMIREGRIVEVPHHTMNMGKCTTTWEVTETSSWTKGCENSR